ncbi:BRO1 domain-containing protein BROX isoform X4 [Agelaius tricolor]|uniref:BRO1 domain-containing protein BROX isoform X4 n=1 Tax=Agelaius tricolor TaxID=9191 RepID=UPI0039F18B24
MTHWFHRNPLKATAPVSFNFYGVATTPAATKVCNDLRLSRTQLLELFTDSSCNPEMMKNAADFYFSLLQGFILSLDDSSQECKLRYIQNFKWTDTLQGQVPSAQQDAMFELVSMGFNVALWYTKYASRLAGKEDITEDEAKDVHRSLKIAAGIFKHLKESHIPKLITPVEKGRDLEARLTESYIIQCQAEAQEVTIARAIELKHNPGLIAALAYETANFYQKADQTLSSLDPTYAGKWRKYLNLKSCFYMAYSDPRRISELRIFIKALNETALSTKRHTVTMARLYWRVINVGKQSDLCRNQKNFLPRLKHCAKNMEKPKGLGLLPNLLDIFSLGN